MGPVDWTQAATIIAALAAFTGVQAFRIARALDGVHRELDRLGARIDRVETRLDSFESAIRDLGERLARLEAGYRGSPAA
jgi:hypothetical protein